MSAAAPTGDMNTPPKFVPPDFDGLPDELKQKKNWVNWRYLPPKTPSGKWRKVPFQPNGAPAVTTDPTTWSTFEECCAAYRRGGYSGVGFVFDGKSDENGLVYAGVDFDKEAFAGDGSLRVAEWIGKLGSYVETSVSGAGQHVILKAQPLGSGIKHGGVELYTSQRYFTMTGRTAGARKPVIAAPAAFADLARHLRQSSGAIKGTLSPSNVVSFRTPDWAIKSRPASAFFGLPMESLTEGLEPDINDIRAAAAAVPPAALAAELDWMKFARAMAHTAALFPKMTPALWEILDETSRRAPNYNERENRSRFERYIREARNCEHPITIATVFDMASSQVQVPTQGHEARTTSAGSATRAVHVSSLPLVPPKRQWLHGADLIRGAVTILVAPGGRAKSTWLLTCALACASGRQLLGSHVFGGPLRVLCLSTEDGMAELALRLRAAMKHYRLTDTDVPGLFVIGADRWGLPLLQAEGNRAILDSRGMEALTAELDHNKPDVLIIDPLINVMGGVNANDNAAAALLMNQLALLTSTRRISIALAHHTSKGRDLTSAESAMGAASFINLARIALAIEPLDQKDAGKIGLPPWEAMAVFRVLGTNRTSALRMWKTDGFGSSALKCQMPNRRPM
jgi:hypothetical protein